MNHFEVTSLPKQIEVHGALDLPSLIDQLNNRYWQHHATYGLGS